MSMQIARDLNDEYLIMSMISRHEELGQNEREEERVLILVSYNRNSPCLKQNNHKAVRSIRKENSTDLLDRIVKVLLFFTRVIPEPQRGALPGARVTNSEMPKSSPIMCWFGLVWTFDLFAHVIEIRGLFKINVEKSVVKQIEITKKQ